MHDLISYHIPGAVQIHIQAVDENGHPLLDSNGKLLRFNQFSVDPQITNFSVLESIIVKAFNLKGDYILSYLNRSSNEYVHLKSDWELECAYLGNAKPLLDIRVQKTIISNLNDDWDIVTTSDLNRVASYAGKQTSYLANNFLNKMEKIVYNAFNKSMFEESEFDENCNKIKIANLNELGTQKIANQTNDNQQTACETTFSKINLLFKFKRKSNLNNVIRNQKVEYEQTNQQINHQPTIQKLEKSETNISNSNPICDKSDDILNGNLKNYLNVSNLISNSHFNLINKKGLNKEQKIEKKYLKARKQSSLNKIKQINSIQDNQILFKILGKVKASQINEYEPLTEQQYFKYLHPDGQIKCLRELRLAIYRRGIESSLRPTLYKHLLNIYPPNMNSEQRVRFVQQKADQYHQLCFTWQRNFSHPIVQQIYNQVRKDVLRTDRSHPFYVSKCNMDTEQQNDITSSVSTYSSILTQFNAQTNQSSINSSFTYDYTSMYTGIDQQVTNDVYENRNVQALTNILTTYALNHKIGYWQGLSDICSPLLLAIQNEAETYICFTALMRRLSSNFCGDECMANKFDCLRKLLQHYDPEFFDYLEKQEASDLLFCYRWLLLELKREFKLESALYMLEVSWAAMPPQFYLDLPMYNKKFVPTNMECSNTNENCVKKNLSSSFKSETKSQQQIDEETTKNSKKLNAELSYESINSSEILSKNDSGKLTDNHSARQIIFGNKLKENNNIRNLKNEMSNAASGLTRQLTTSVNQIKQSVNEVANAASEFYANLNNQKKFQQQSNSFVKSRVRSTLKGLKLSSVEEQLTFKREKFHQQSTAGNSVNSLNDMRFSLDKESETDNQRKSKNSSLNGSNHSLIEYNSTLNYILNKTQAMLKQQEQKFSKLNNFRNFQNFNFNLNSRKQPTSNSNLFTNGKESHGENQSDTNSKCLTESNHRHIRFLPKILSTDSNENTIDSPDADDLNEKCRENFSNFMNKQFSIDSVDSLEFNNDCASTLNSSQLYNNQKYSTSFNNNLNNFKISSFTKQNSTPSQATLLKQQLKQSFNQQKNNFNHFKQRSLPNSPIFKKKLSESFDRPLLPFLQNVSNIFVTGQQHQSSLLTKNFNNSNKSYNTASNNYTSQPTSLSSKRSKLVSNQFDSFDQRDLFVHCNGENETTTNNSTIYNFNWKPERGLLNCFDSTSFDASSTFQPYQSANQSIPISHQQLARQLSDKQINDKMYNSLTSVCQNNNAEKNCKRISTQILNQHQANSPKAQIEGSLLEQNFKSNLNLINTSIATVNAAYEKEEKSEGYCSGSIRSGSISDRNSNYEEPCDNHLESDNHSRLMLTNTFSNSIASLKSSSSSGSGSSSSISSLSCSSSLVILSSSNSFRSKIAHIKKMSNTLPSPGELSGSGTNSNAFSLFICLTILLLHRDKIINDNLDANDIAIYFNSHVRRHDVHLVVNIARELFQVYLNKWRSLKILEEADQTVLDSILIDDQVN